MNNEPLVSAIIIFLDGEKFLTEAIESVIHQTYTNWELLLVDDGSADTATGIARSYANSFPHKIKYLEHEGHQNKGMSATRNLGINHSKGDLVGFLDADDIWLPNKLAEQVSVFNHHPECGMVYGRTEIWHSWAGKADNIPKDYFYPLGVMPDSVVHPPKIALLLLENKAQSPTTCNALLKKDVFEKVGLFLEDFKGMFEDAAFFIKIGLTSPIYVSDRVWARYRQHDESCTLISEKSNADEQTRYKFLKWVERHLNAKRIFSLKIRVALYQEIMMCQNRLLRNLLKGKLKNSKPTA